MSRSPIRLPAGQPVRLHFVNQSRGDDGVQRAAPSSAPRGCARATATSSARGGFRLAPGERRYVDLVAAPRPLPRAQLQPRSTALLGMSAEIVVE